MIGAVEDAMGYATAGKLNDIQIRALYLNLESINKIYNPPVLPSATVTPIATGLEGLTRVLKTRFPKESHKFFGRPLKDKDFAEIDRLVAEGKLPPAGVKGATSIGPVKGRSYKYVDEQGKTRIMPSKEWSEGAKRAITEGEELGSRLPDPGTAGVNAMLDQKTGMSRAIAREILQKDVRLNLKPEELYSLRTGAKGEDPIDLMVKYYGRSMENFDDFLNNVNLEAAAPAEFAEMVLKNVRLIPQFAHGGLARILEV